MLVKGAISRSRLLSGTLDPRTMMSFERFPHLKATKWVIQQSIFLRTLGRCSVLLTMRLRSLHSVALASG